MKKKEESQQEALTSEITSALTGVDVANLIIAYEPIASIGTGNVMPNKEIEEVITWIKDFVYKNYSEKVPVLYGGSVNEKNIFDLTNIDIVDGILVGKASLDTKKVKVMMEVLSNARIN